MAQVAPAQPQVMQPQMMQQQQVMMQVPNYGIQPLTQVPVLYIKQKADILEAMTGVEKKNKYGIFVNKGDDNKWLIAYEESDCCQRIFWRPRHDLTMHVKQPNGPDILTGHRPCHWCYGDMKVYDSNGNRLIGELRQDCASNICGILSTKTTVHGPDGQQQFEIIGPTRCWIDLCKSCPCRDPMDFVAKDSNGKDIGAKVQNVSGGCLRSLTNADDYFVHFAPNSTADQRSLMLMFTFFLDFCYFEAKGDGNQNNSGMTMS
jgi:hypothetical protein